MKKEGNYLLVLKAALDLSAFDLKMTTISTEHKCKGVTKR
jgi:hypothetical protein